MADAKLDEKTVDAFQEQKATIQALLQHITENQASNGIQTTTYVQPVRDVQAGQGGTPNYLLYIGLGIAAIILFKIL